jgi:hypothetical protein
MLFSALLTLFAATSAVFADVTGSESKAARRCRERLETVVFTPQVCAFDYLKRITKSLVLQSPLLWTDQASSVLNQFRQKYGVYVVLIDAFGNLVLDPPQVLTIPNIPLAQSTGLMRSWALGEGFSTYDRTVLETIPISAFTYSVNVWNIHGEIYNIAVILNKTDAPTYC